MSMPLLPTAPSGVKVETNYTSFGNLTVALCTAEYLTAKQTAEAELKSFNNVYFTFYFITPRIRNMFNL